MALIMAAVAEEGLIGTEPPVDVDARAQRFRASIEADGPGASWVLDDGGRVVGHAGAHERAAGVLYLGMAILREARGQGGGRALLQAILDHAQTNGAHKLELEVWIDNARAIALYASTGFEVEGLRRNHYRRQDGSLRSALVMARLLDSGASHYGRGGSPPLLSCQRLPHALGSRAKASRAGGGLMVIVLSGGGGGQDPVSIGDGAHLGGGARHRPSRCRSSVGARCPSACSEGLSRCTCRRCRSPRTAVAMDRRWDPLTARCIRWRQTGRGPRRDTRRPRPRSVRGGKGAGLSRPGAHDRGCAGELIDGCRCGRCPGLGPAGRIGRGRWVRERAATTAPRRSPDRRPPTAHGRSRRRFARHHSTRSPRLSPDDWRRTRRSGSPPRTAGSTGMTLPPAPAPTYYRGKRHTLAPPVGSIRRTYPSPAITTQERTLRHEIPDNVRDPGPRANTGGSRSDAQPRSLCEVRETCTMSWRSTAHTGAPMGTTARSAADRRAPTGATPERRQSDRSSPTPGQTRPPPHTAATRNTPSRPDHPH